MSPSRYFKLGLFVLSGLALLFGGIVTLGAGKLFQNTLAAETYSDESVTGLDPGAPVRYRGVPVGKVEDIRLAVSKYPGAVEANGLPTRKIVIELSLDVDAMNKSGEPALRRMVRDGLRARIMQAGLTGLPYLGLDFVDPRAAPPPSPITWTPRRLYIPSVPSTSTVIVNGFERLMNELQEVDVPGITGHFDALLGDARQAIHDLQIASIREQAVALLNEARQTNARVHQLLGDARVEAALHDLPEITGHLKTSLAQVDQIVHDQRVDRALTGLSDASVRAGPAVADAQRVIRDVHELMVAEGDDLRSAIADLRVAMENLTTATDDAKRNPSRLLFGKPPAHRKPGD